MTQSLTTDERGSTLVEALIAMCVLTIALLGVAQLFGTALRQSSTAGPAMIAREKAREAVESVHTARDTKTITWAQIRNKKDGGIFTDGETPLRLPGDDGMVNTDDDCTSVGASCPATLDFTWLPGKDGKLGTADDEKQPLTQFTREIVITDVQGSPALRQLTVIIRYHVGKLTPPPFQLVTFVSSYS